MCNKKAKQGSRSRAASRQSTARRNMMRKEHYRKPGWTARKASNSSPVEQNFQNTIFAKSRNLASNSKSTEIK